MNTPESDEVRQQRKDDLAAYVRIAYRGHTWLVASTAFLSVALYLLVGLWWWLGVGVLYLVIRYVLGRRIG